MKTFEENVISRLRLLEREVERLRVGDKAVAITDHGALSGLSDDDHPQYVHDTGDETIAGTKTFSSIPVLPSSDPTSANQAVRKGYADETYGRPVFLTTPKTSDSWDGDARSTTAKTKIDLSDVFGVPAGVKAVLAMVVVRDSASAANDCYLTLSPDNTNPTAGIHFDCSGLANDKWERETGIIPCNVDGDVYYKIGASGTSTLDAIIEIWGWWL